MDTDSDNDEEDIRQLTAVLEADNLISSSKDSIASSSSQCSNSTLYSTSSQDKPQYYGIQNALALNKLTDEKLHRLEIVFVARLKECQKKLKELKRNIFTSKNKDRPGIFRYATCGKPYFKDRFNFLAPDNQDTIAMAETGLYNFSDVTPVSGWTNKEKRNLLTEILLMSRDIRKKEWTSKISQLIRENKGQINEQLDKQIARINQRIDDIDEMPLNERLVLPRDQDYDWDSIASRLNERHSAQEYRSLWKLFLHPAINKNSWTKAEHNRLQDIARAHSVQDWDKIAEELNSNRTGYQCFVYFRTNLANTLTGQKWTKEEEEYLRRLIEYYKEEDYIL